MIQSDMILTGLLEYMHVTHTGLFLPSPFFERTRDKENKPKPLHGTETLQKGRQLICQGGTGIVSTHLLESKIIFVTY